MYLQCTGPDTGRQRELGPGTHFLQRSCRTIWWLDLISAFYSMILESRGPRPVRMHVIRPFTDGYYFFPHRAYFSDEEDTGAQRPTVTCPGVT